MDGIGLGVLENPGGRVGVGNWVRVKKLTTNIRSSGILPELMRLSHAFRARGLELH